MTLLDAARMLHDGARITVPHDLGTTEATVIGIDNRGACPLLLAVTDADLLVKLPIDGTPARGEP